MVEPGEGPHTIDEYVRGYETDRRIRGLVCRSCGARTATWGLACSRCGAAPLEEVDLAQTGTIVAGTIVAVASDEFVNDAPYGYVLVALDGGGTVSGWIPGARTEAEIAPGTRVRFEPSYKPGLQFRRSEAPGATLA